MKNHKFGKVNCPNEFTDVESFEGMIVEGPNHIQSADSYDYSLFSNKKPVPHLSIVGNTTFHQVKAELEARGTLAGVIEFDQDGEWLGMIFEKDLGFTDPREQDHFAKCVFNGSTRI